MAGHSYSGFQVYELNGLHNCTMSSFAVVGGKMAESGLQSPAQRVGYLKVSSAALLVEPQVASPWLSVNPSQSHLRRMLQSPRPTWSVMNKPAPLLLFNMTRGICNVQGKSRRGPLYSKIHRAFLSFKKKPQVHLNYPKTAVKNLHYTKKQQQRMANPKTTKNKQKNKNKTKTKQPSPEKNKTKKPTPKSAIPPFLLVLLCGDFT